MIHEIRFFTNYQMSVKVKDSKRMELICEFLRSGKQPDGFTITEPKNGKYRLSRVKSQKEVLETKRQRLQKNIEEIDNELKKFNEQKQEQDDKPVEE